MKMTSAQAAKLLRKYNEEIDTLLYHESISQTFLAAVGEDIETVRPDYDYEKTQEEIRSVQEKIRKLKHTLNVFNSTTVVPGFNMTIDEMLIYIPQLTSLKSKYSSQKNVLPKTREMSRNSATNILDYRYANYDVDKAKSDFDEISLILSNAQTALDIVNNTVEMEIDL